MCIVSREASVSKESAQKQPTATAVVGAVYQLDMILPTWMDPGEISADVTWKAGVEVEKLSVELTGYGLPRNADLTTSSDVELDLDIHRDLDCRRRLTWTSKWVGDLDTAIRCRPAGNEFNEPEVEKLTAKLTPGDVVVTSDGCGTCLELRFTPLRHGLHLVDVRCGSLPVTGSPFYVVAVIAHSSRSEDDDGHLGQTSVVDGACSSKGHLTAAVLRRTSKVGISINQSTIASSSSSKLLTWPK